MHFLFSSILNAKLNSSGPKPSSENGIPISREPVNVSTANNTSNTPNKSINLLNELITKTNGKPIKEKQPYSYGAPNSNNSSTKSSNQIVPKQNGSHSVIPKPHGNYYFLFLFFALQSHSNKRANF